MGQKGQKLFKAVGGNGMRMGKYQQLELRELYEDKPGCNARVEVKGKVIQPIRLIKKSPRWEEYFTKLTDFSGSLVTTLYFDYSLEYRQNLKETIEEAYKSTLPLIVRGYYYHFSDVNYFQAFEAELDVKGRVSLTDNLEGKLSIAEEGRLSLGKLWQNILRKK